MDDVGVNEGGQIPSEEIGIQINFCKNPECSNFGVPASSERQLRGRGNKVQDTYRIGGGVSKLRNAPVLNCLLHGIDRFFMQVRRLLSPMERPIRTASNSGRAWHQYSLYNPGLLGKLLAIFRVHYNYRKLGDDGQTPAMRLGLAKGLIESGEIFNFQPFKPAPKRKNLPKKIKKENRPTPVVG